MLFKENASKLLSISRMTKDEYVPKEEEPDKILNEEIPKAMQIFTCSLSDGYFCDVGSTPLAFLARQVGGHPGGGAHVHRPSRRWGRYSGRP